MPRAPGFAVSRPADRSRNSWGAIRLASVCMMKEMCLQRRGAQTGNKYEYTKLLAAGRLRLMPLRYTAAAGSDCKIARRGVPCRASKSSTALVFQ
jgi:hypothetical protein